MLVSGLTLCCYADQGKDESGKGKKAAQHREDDDPSSYFQRRGYTRLNIPPATILRRANAGSGFQAAHQASSYRPATVDG